MRWEEMVSVWDLVPIQPYMTEINSGSASLMPAYNQIYRTFMVANYGANGGCIDNDLQDFLSTGAAHVTQKDDTPAPVCGHHRS